MSTTKKEPLKVEMIISTYWPAKVIKSIQLKEAGKDTYRNDITLSAQDAKYVYQQLKAIFGESMSKQPDKEHTFEDTIAEVKMLSVRRRRAAREEKFVNDLAHIIAIDGSALDKARTIFEFFQANYTPNHLVEQRCLEARKVTGETSDGYHTFNELYDFRKVYNALLFNEWAAQRKFNVYKSKLHSDGEIPFGGGWFVVGAQLSTGQITNHYELRDWDLFTVPEVPRAAVWDGHTAQQALERMLAQLTNLQNKEDV